jgi:hypothetical protein
MHEHPREENATARLLREIADLCEHASLTGALDGGAPRVARRYNALLQQAQRDGQVPAGIFEPLAEEETSFGEIGVEARMLRAYLKEPAPDGGRKDAPLDVLVRLAPFIRSEDLGALVRRHVEEGARVSLDLLVPLAPFLNPEEINRIMEQQMSRSRPTPPSPPSPPSPPAPPLPARPVGDDEVRHLVDALRRPDLPEAERAHLMARLQEIVNS